MPSKEFIYPYGKDYDNIREQRPSEKSEYDLIIYVNLRGEERVISSLEGVFISQTDLSRGRSDFNNPLCRRRDMPKFERAVGGKFVPFKRYE